MYSIKKKYIVDRKNRKVAMQIPIETFEQIEEILENHALVQLIDVNTDDEELSLNEAKSYYSHLTKE